MSSRSNRGRYWSFGYLMKRGWTSELIKQLLPKPTFHFVQGRNVRTWHRQEVLSAEESETFLENTTKPRPRPAPKPRPCPAPEPEKRTFGSSAEVILKTNWENTEKPEDSTALLAEYYHKAILRNLSAAAKKAKEHPLPPSYSAGYAGEFLSFQKHDRPKAIPSALNRFCQATPWIEQRGDHSLSARVMDHYGEVLLSVAKSAIRAFAADHPETDVEAFLRMKGFPYEKLLTNPLSYLYSVYYVPFAIRNSLNFLIALNPKDEYPEARAMSRRFILHIGGTNTGKTYAGFQRLIQAKTGVYLGPLRLLALEAQEALLDAGVDCSLTTGEEEDVREGDTHVAATAEKLNLKQYYDVAVIDECQMVADRERGYAWTRAILGVQAPEVHLCAAPQAKDLLIRLIESCGDEYEVELHKRKTPLLCMSHTVDFTRVQPGDALITFSKVGVLSIAEDLRQQGKEPAIIYGALPYSTRRKQMKGFLDGDMGYVVSTDAIGMGLNLPIRRIIFMETEKFDGVERRELKPDEIQQIAGRAGRYGMYDKGYVGATGNLPLIRAGLNTVVPPLQQAVVGFSDLVLSVDYDLLEVLTEWNKIPTVEPYVKLDITRYLTIITKMRHRGFFLTKEEELRAANIPFDEDDMDLRKLFFAFLRLRQEGETISRPALPEESAHTLPELELFCRKLDLFFSFCKAFDIPVDIDELYDVREAAAEEINEILLHRLKNNIRFCAICNAPLPIHHRWRVCDNCYRRKRHGGTSRG